MKKLITALILIIVSIITTGAGYMGTLPDIEAEFSYLKKEVSKKAIAPYSIEELDKKNEESLKPIPRNNDNYVDIIIKKDKSSKYMNDMNSVIMILEKLRRCINTDMDIQKFNAIVSNLIDNTDYIIREYRGKPEENYLSYNRIQYVSNEARNVASFRLKSQTAIKYIPYNSKDNIYTKANLDSQMQSLLNNVNETIFILKNLE